MLTLIGGALFYFSLSSSQNSISLTSIPEFPEAPEDKSKSSILEEGPSTGSIAPQINPEITNKAIQPIAPRHQKLKSKNPAPTRATKTINQNNKKPAKKDSFGRFNSLASQKPAGAKKQIDIEKKLLLEN